MSEESAKATFDGIWKQFSIDRRESRATAAAKLQRSLAEHAADLVPMYATAKELMSMVFECEQYTKEDKQSESGDPLSNMSGWLRGDVELSRIPLETVRKQ